MEIQKLQIEIGARYGRLVVLRYVGIGAYGKRAFECVCDCGNIKIVSGSDLKAKKVISCGCARSEASRNQRGHHGHVGEPIYVMWSNMKRRCLCEKNPEYKSYGGRGITVCDDWMDFRNFYVWAVSAGYAPGLSIERKDVNGSYCPENCTFIAPELQCLNRQSTVLYKGECLKKVCEKRGLKYSSVHARIHKLGWGVERAVETPF